jgi:hypothetical protein
LDESTSREEAQMKYDENLIFACCPSRSSVFIFDDFHEDPDAVRADALQLPYTEDGDSDFPGMRSWHPTPVQMFDFFERVTRKRPRRIDTNFESQRENDRADSFIHGEYTDWAAVIYLSADASNRSGTSLYRHKGTGLNRLPDAFGLVQLSRQAGMEPITVIAKLTEKRFELDRWKLLVTAPVRYNRLRLTFTATPRLGERRSMTVAWGRPSLPFPLSSFTSRTADPFAFRARRLEPTFRKITCMNCPEEGQPGCRKWPWPPG